METDALPARNGTGHGPDHRVTILVADDNERFRSGIVRALARRPGVVVVGEVENGALALDHARALRPDVVLADARMPLMDGLDVARAVAADGDLGSTRVVILSARHDERLCDDAAAAGAVGCLDKGDSRREICDAVLQLAASTAPS